ncbi:SRPBCC domain-containing protein [Glutamicibacter endophyticus]|uniref:SRPBCC domain-containing protein n=1 Tax=Glutamicibacter endophyticus TaxID=1522174 RepID=UPI003AEFDBE6
MTRIDTTERMLNAVPERVYEALTDGAALQAWLPPAGMRAEFLALDPRPGGSFHMILHYPPGQAGLGKSTATTDEVVGHYTELVPHERVVLDVHFVNPDGSHTEAMTMSFDIALAANGTLVNFSAENPPASISASDHHVGMSQSLEQLAEYLIAQAERERG